MTKTNLRRKNHQTRKPTVTVPQTKTIIANIQKPYTKSRTSDSRSKPTYASKPKATKICTYCNKPGHTIEICFKKHGLPPYLKRANMAQTATEEPDHDDSPTSQIEESQDVGFISEQHHALLALLQQATTTTEASIQHL
ncbi:unnamed protein product [Vicia faba]|uniref:Uncharacterized protein n=1 Tax=Vicia faba TaxID=3906 RepID=A0AAV1AM66_VICFA|nr:unnamed protein product [Vicia faba]